MYVWRNFDPRNGFRASTEPVYACLKGHDAERWRSCGYKTAAAKDYFSSAAGRPENTEPTPTVDEINRQLTPIRFSRFSIRPVPPAFPKA